ncbi:MAG: ribonuclease T [Pseudomonadales bacterium]|nr:ribonuclease T [Pseudomonadales bacterium]
MAERFRDYLPVVVDIETGGFNAQTDAVLEIAAVFVSFDNNLLIPGPSVHHNVTPKLGTNIEPASLKITGIDLTDPNRVSMNEQSAFKDLFTHIRQQLKNHSCQRAILVAHNAAFDQQFINSVCERSKVSRNPFHPFSVIDTASLSALAVGHTVLAKSCERANIDFDARCAHSALYDAQKTAELFCSIVNRWQTLGGWPLGKNYSDADTQ